jgi:hypothetical protein
VGPTGCFLNANRTCCRRFRSDVFCRHGWRGILEWVKDLQRSISERNARSWKSFCQMPSAKNRDVWSSVPPHGLRTRSAGPDSHFEQPALLSFSIDDDERNQRPSALMGILTS